MAKSKKKYWYTTKSVTKRTQGGANVVLWIYTIKRGEIVNVGSVRYNTAATKGEKHEVYHVLHERKLVSNREYKAAKGYWRESTSKIIIKVM